MERPEFSYERGDNKIIDIEINLQSNLKKKIDFVDHTIKIKGFDMGLVYLTDQSVFRATEIIFHTPGEHRINGILPDLEVQIVHQGITNGDLGRNVVLSIGFKHQVYRKNRFFEKIGMENLPSNEEKSKELNREIFIPDLFYAENDSNLSQMKKPSMFYYKGSMTSPPCTEDVEVFVMADLLPLDLVAIGMLKNAARAEEVGNNREIQSRNGRNIYLIKGEVVASSEEEFHYEKINYSKKRLIQMDKEEISNIPGAVYVPN